MYLRVQRNIKNSNFVRTVVRTRAFQKIVTFIWNTVEYIHARVGFNNNTLSKFLPEQKIRSGSCAIDTQSEWDQFRKIVHFNYQCSDRYIDG